MKQTYIYTLIGIAALGIFVLAAREQARREQARQEQAKKEEQTTATTNTAAAPRSLDLNKVLKKGSSGAEVRELQRLMNKEPQGLLDFGEPRISEDGVFGDATERTLQIRRGHLTKEVTLQQFKDTATTA